ncbi:MAG: hypothetical protein ACFFBP_09615 [Promethearchaeota archaeon]
MVINSEERYSSNIINRNIENNFILPSCYSNYCENHISCKKCDVNDKCKLIPRPLEPKWCNPD